MKGYNEDGLRNLACAIVEQAAVDYRAAASGYRNAHQIARDSTRTTGERAVYRGHETRYQHRLDKLEAFFTGEYCHHLCGDAAGAILSGLRAECTTTPT